MEGHKTVARGDYQLVLHDRVNAAFTGPMAVTSLARPSSLPATRQRPVRHFQGTFRPPLPVLSVETLDARRYAKLSPEAWSISVPLIPFQQRLTAGRILHNWIIETPRACC